MTTKIAVIDNVTIAKGRKYENPKKNITNSAFD
jgi:hypothetical protein